MLIIGIAGGSGSGKTTVVNKIIKNLPNTGVSVISQDAYYKDNGHLSKEEKHKINFDHPDSLEFDLLIKHLDQLIEGKAIDMPLYSYVTCSRHKETMTIQPTAVIIVEGILIFSCKELTKRFGMKVFVDTDSDDRLMRILRRDVIERGRNYQTALTHYEKFVKPMHLQFIEPSKRIADIIVPQGGNNLIAIDVLRTTILSSIK